MRESTLKDKKDVTEETSSGFVADYASLLDCSRSIVDDVYRELYYGGPSSGETKDEKIPVEDSPETAVSRPRR
jgi:hypothetical protein